MASLIKKIRLINFRRFKDFTVEPNERINIFIGDNEAGKSSILEAIDIVTNGNKKRVEAIGLDKLLNIDAVKEFNAGERKFENLPVLRVELYLSGQFDFTMNGKNNTAGIECDGIRLVCMPDPDYRTEIADVLAASPDYFPYDYYSIHFTTFMDEPYTGYKKKIRSVLIDSSHMNSEYATNDFVRRMYMQYTAADVKERAAHRSSYRQMRDTFKTSILHDLNGRVPSDKNYSFGLRGSSVNEFETDLMIYEDEIGIDNKGTGRQVLIKTDFALERAGDNVDIILIEEPENHLSHTNLRKLIQCLANTRNGQMFITTHNSLISTRLELKNLLIVHTNSTGNPVTLKELSDETARYFMKAPPATIVEFALADKAILVEGPSEYMLMEKFYTSCVGNLPEMDGVHIIDVRGLSFKRYLDVAKLTGAKVAVITDNDEDAQKHCIDKYKDYAQVDNINVFFEADNSKRTFEIVLFNDNIALCKDLFGDTPEEYMLNNKTEAAYILLSQGRPITVPDYIKRAIEWIKG